LAYRDKKLSVSLLRFSCAEQWSSRRWAKCCARWPYQHPGVRVEVVQVGCCRFMNAL
jgi:hypothetical protein